MNTTKIKVLVVGGAGYIGSVTNKLMEGSGYNCAVLDNLEEGLRKNIGATKLFLADIRNIKDIDKTLQAFKPDIIMHFAAYAHTDESCIDPASYYENNVAGSINLISSALKHKVKGFIFSSSCATYGVPSYIPINENTVQNPINPYGETKLIIEKLLSDIRRLNKMQTCSLRYFNVAGATPDGNLGEEHLNEKHIIPKIFNAVIFQEEFSIFGNNYSTPDGTCIRDYVHVLDIARAHALIADRMIKNLEYADHYNVGTGKGYSNLQLLKIIEKLTGKKINVSFKKARIGDPPILVASGAEIEKQLGFKLKYSDIDTILNTHWQFINKRKD